MVARGGDLWLIDGRSSLIGLLLFHVAIQGTCDDRKENKMLLSRIVYKSTPYLFIVPDSRGWGEGGLGLAV